MRLKAGPEEHEARNERQQNAAHETRHPGWPIGTPKVNQRGAAEAGIRHVVPPFHPFPRDPSYDGARGHPRRSEQPALSPAPQNLLDALICERRCRRDRGIAKPGTKPPRPHWSNWRGPWLRYQLESAVGVVTIERPILALSAGAARATGSVLRLLILTPGSAAGVRRGRLSIIF